MGRLWETLGHSSFLTKSMLNTCNGGFLSWFFYIEHLCLWRCLSCSSQASFSSAEFSLHWRGGVLPLCADLHNSPSWRLWDRVSVLTLCFVSRICCFVLSLCVFQLLGIEPGHANCPSTKHIYLTLFLFLFWDSVLLTCLGWSVTNSLTQACLGYTVFCPQPAE